MSTNPQFPVLLNVSMSEGDEHCDIRADITGFRAKYVRVTPWEDSLVVEMEVQQAPPQSYYMGEMDLQTVQRIIPLSFEADPKSVITHFMDGKLDVFVTKLAESYENRLSSAAA